MVVGVVVIAVCDVMITGIERMLASDQPSQPAQPILYLLLTGMWLGSPSEIFSFEISDFSFFLCAGFWIPMAVRSSGVILEMVGKS